MLAEDVTAKTFEGNPAAMSPNEPPPGDPAPAAAAGTPSPSTATSPRLASRGNSIGEAQVVHSPGATAPQPGRARSQSSGQLSGTNSVHATPWIARAALGPLGHIAPQQKSPISPGDYVELTTYRDEESGLIGSDSEATVRPGGSPRGMSSLDDMDLPDGEDPIVYSGGDGEQLLQKSGPEPGSEILELELDGNGTVVSHGEALSSPLRRRRKFSEGFGPWARDLLAQTWDEWTTLDWRLVSQATPSLILATSGLILAGWLLDIVQVSFSMLRRSIFGFSGLNVVFHTKALASL